MLHNYESYSNEPKAVIRAYTVKDKNGAIIKDYSHNKTKCFILDSADEDNIEIIYSDKSPKYNELKDLCDSNDELF